MQCSVGSDLCFTRAVVHVTFIPMAFMYFHAQGSSSDFMAAQQYLIYSVILLKCNYNQNRVPTLKERSARHRS